MVLSDVPRHLLWGQRESGVGSVSTEPTVGASHQGRVLPWAAILMGRVRGRWYLLFCQMPWVPLAVSYLRCGPWSPGKAVETQERPESSPKDRPRAGCLTTSSVCAGMTVSSRVSSSSPC